MKFMKRCFFILVFIPFISYCQTNTEFKLQNSFPVGWGKNCISKIDCFYLSLDSALVFDDDDIYDYYYTLYYSYGNENMQQIVTGDWSDLGYSLTLHSFKSEKGNSYIVFWKKEFEFSPVFDVYYIINGMVLKIGEWGVAISRIVHNCEFCDYSVEDIRITQKNNEIEFSFLKEMQFTVINEEYDYDDWGTFKAGELTVSFSIIDGTVNRVER